MKKIRSVLTGSGRKGAARIREDGGMGGGTRKSDGRQGADGLGPGAQSTGVGEQWERR
jgi:hypothetical protein